MRPFYLYEEQTHARLYGGSAYDWVTYDLVADQPMRASPILQSFVHSMSSRERHPLDDEFFILSHVKPEGNVVGHLGNLPIPAGVIGEDGRHYVFEGVAPRRPSGRFDVDTLRPGEWIVRPGLVYRQID